MTTVGVWDFNSNSDSDSDRLWQICSNAPMPILVLGSLMQILLAMNNM